MKRKRISKDEYYLNIAKAVGRRSNCLMVDFGCIIVRDDQIISTGYVGAPRKVKDCMEIGYCIRRKKGVASGTGYEMCRSVHAEMNAIINAARSGGEILNADMYLYAAKKGAKEGEFVKAYPCLLCKKMIINAGIRKFIGNDPDGSFTVYEVKDWVREWNKSEDITLDKEKYQVNYKSKKPKKHSK
jgi:dCMP deaminase